MPRVIIRGSWVQQRVHEGRREKSREISADPGEKKIELLLMAGCQRADFRESKTKDQRSDLLFLMNNFLISIVLTIKINICFKIHIYILFYLLHLSVSI